MTAELAAGGAFDRRGTSSTPVANTRKSEAQRLSPGGYVEEAVRSLLMAVALAATGSEPNAASCSRILRKRLGPAIPAGKAEWL
jgi:hypothetical protein